MATPHPDLSANYPPSPPSPSIPLSSIPHFLLSCLLTTLPLPPSSPPSPSLPPSHPPYIQSTLDGGRAIGMRLTTYQRVQQIQRRARATLLQRRTQQLNAGSLTSVPSGVRGRGRGVGRGRGWGRGRGRGRGGAGVTQRGGGEEEEEEEEREEREEERSRQSSTPKRGRGRGWGIRGRGRGRGRGVASFSAVGRAVGRGQARLSTLVQPGATPRPGSRLKIIRCIGCVVKMFI